MTGQVDQQMRRGSDRLDAGSKAASDNTDAAQCTDAGPSLTGERHRGSNDHQSRCEDDRRFGPWMCGVQG